MSKFRYQRVGDDTFLVLVEGQRPIKGRALETGRMD